MIQIHQAGSRRTASNFGLPIAFELLAIGAEEASPSPGGNATEIGCQLFAVAIEQRTATKSMRQQAWYFDAGFIDRGQRRLRSDLRRGFEAMLGDSRSDFFVVRPR